MAAVIRNKAAKKKLLKYIICFIICLAVVIVSLPLLYRRSLQLRLIFVPVKRTKIQVYLIYFFCWRFWR